MSDWWPVLVLLLPLGLTVWGYWPVITGRSSAPWDDDEGDEE